MATVNKHGVITNPEVVVLASGPKYHLEARLAEHQGRWYAGASYDWGGISVGSCGGGWLPWIDNNPIPPQLTRQAAVDRVADLLRDMLNKNERHYNPRKNDPVRKVIRLALLDLEAFGPPKQMRLFA